MDDEQIEIYGLIRNVSNLYFFVLILGWSIKCLKISVDAFICSKRNKLRAHINQTTICTSKNSDMRTRKMKMHFQKLYVLMKKFGII